MQKTPYIDVHVPNKVIRGDLMVIYARFIDLDTLQLVKVPTVYLQIISTDDHEYWQTSLIKQNISVLHIAIGTLEMKDDNYVVKVSDHKEMMEFGFNRVKLRKPWGVFKNKKRPVKIQLC